MPAEEAGDTTELAATQVETAVEELVTVPIMEPAVQSPRSTEDVIVPTHRVPALDHLESPLDGIQVAGDAGEADPQPAAAPWVALDLSESPDDVVARHRRLLRMPWPPFG